MYIYIYNIYLCVCVCVCDLFLFTVEDKIASYVDDRALNAMKENNLQVSKEVGNLKIRQFL